MGNLTPPFKAVIVLNILHLEDNDEDALLVERALSKAGYAISIRRARNKPEFVAQLAANPDLILSDFHLPDFDALGALDQLKDRGLDLPLILVSGAARDEDVMEAMKRGAADFVFKDRLVRLGAAISATLEYRALRRQARETQLALERNREELDYAFGNAAIGMALTSLDSRWLKVNQALCTMLGYSESELLASDCHSVTAPDDIAGDIELTRRLVGGEFSSTQREKRYLHKLGHMVWVQVTASLVRGRDGTPRYRMLQVLDISHRVEAEKRFQATFEQAAVGIAHTTMAGRFLAVNDKLCEMLGYAREELMRATTLELSHPAARGEHATLYQDVLEGRRLRFAAEKQWVRKDGTVIWINRTVSRAEGVTGQEPYFIQVIEDITERKRAEQAQQQSQQSYETLVASIDGIVWEADAQTYRFLFVSRQAERLLGYPVERWIDEPTFWQDHMHPDDRDWAVAYCIKATGELRSHDFEYRMIAADGRVVWLRDIVNLTVENGRPVLSRGIMVDITAAKQAQALSERLLRARRVLAGCNRVVMHAANETQLMQDICRLAIEAGDFRQAWIGLKTEDAVAGVRAAAQAGYGDSNAPMIGASNWSDDGRYRGLASEAIASGEACIARDILNNPAQQRKRMRAIELEYQSSIALPLKEAGRVFGALTLHAAEKDAFDEEEIGLLVEIAADLAFGIESIRTREAHREAARQLRESEQRFRETFEQAAVGITRVDLDGVLVDVNQKFCDMLGYSRDELIGKAIRDITHPADYGRGARYRAQLEHSVMTSTAGEKRFLRKDGTLLWARRTMSTACDESGKPQYVISVVEDIGERKTAEEAVARERTLLRTIIDALPDRIYVKDRDGRHLMENAASRERRVPYTADVLGKTVFDLYPREVAERLHAEDRAVIETGKALVNRERSSSNASGAIRWHTTSKMPFRNAAGEVAGTVGVSRDVTEQRRAETERARLAAIVESSDDAIISRTLEGTILTWNPGAERLFGWSAAEALGSGISIFIPPGHDDELRHKAERLRRGESVTSFDTVRRRKDGRLVNVSLSQSPVRNEHGELIAVSSIFRDVTERVRSERWRTMEHAVTRVLAEREGPDEALPRVIRVMCEAMNWAYGARWAWQPAERRLCRAEYWSSFELDFDPADRERWSTMTADGSGGLLRAAWRREAPAWLTNVEEDEGFRRKPSCAKLGLRSAFAFPILGGNMAIGLMEFFGIEEREPDEVLLQVTESIGRQVGQFVQRKQAEAALRESEEQFRQLANNIPQVFWITDVSHRQMLYVSPAVERLMGRSLQELHAAPRALVRAVHVEDRARVRAARKDAAAGGYDETYRVVRPDGSIRWVHDRAFPVHDESGGVYRIAGIAEDVTDRKQAEERLLQLAHYDVLTSLPNRVLFYDRLKQVLAQARRNQWIVGVIFIDVDRFKNVNDTLGHVVGDQLLQQVSERLTQAVRTGDTVGRLGGDEFAVVLSNLASAQDASLVAQKVMASFTEPFRLEGAEIYVTASIGITLYPDDSAEQDVLIRNADAAMYRAKEVGRNSYQFYTPEMNQRALEILNMESSLRRAFDRNEFLLHFQPKAGLADGEIAGVEALLRWQHPERGLVSPAVFMAVLEETGLIVPVGEWVLKAVCAQIKAWKAAGIKPVPVAVNLSARQFGDRDLGPTIRRILEEHRVDPSLIELEITESALMANTEDAVRTLEYLEALGVGLSIDDFGTGYSSLGYLKRFPLTSLKVDRSFVRDITTDVDDATITRAVISMAHSLGLKVIAEGVETEAQLAFLAEYGCDEIQGYYFSRPLPADECGAWLSERRGLRRAAQVPETAPVVLLVDDDDDALILLKRSLNKDGYRILAARNAHEALDMLSRQHVDVVISDQSMPGVPGVEFLQRVKQLSPRTVRMMTSGHTDFQMVADAVNKGEIYRFLPKSVKEEQLRGEVREALLTRARFGQDGHYAAPGTIGK